VRTEFDEPARPLGSVAVEEVWKVRIISLGEVVELAPASQLDPLARWDIVAQRIAAEFRGDADEVFPYCSLFWLWTSNSASGSCLSAAFAEGLTWTRLRSAGVIPN
jgi:hypothetical protein